MSILSDVRLLEKIYDKELVIEPFIYDHIQPSSIDLTLDGKIKVPKVNLNEAVNVFDKEATEKLFDEQSLDEYILQPGGFVIGQIKEFIRIPSNCTGNIQNRNSLIRLGIDVGLSTYINPGYAGKLPIVIKNLGSFSIKLIPGMRVCQLIVNDAKPKPQYDYSTKSDAKYHGEKDISLSRLYLDSEFTDYLDSKEVKDRSLNSEEIKAFFENRIKEKAQSFLSEFSEEQKKELGI